MSKIFATDRHVSGSLSGRNHAGAIVILEVSCGLDEYVCLCARDVRKV